MSTLSPKDHAEGIALFRSEIVGALTRRELDRGELALVLTELSQQRFRPPRATSTKAYSIPTLERRYYAYKSGGLEGHLAHPCHALRRASARKNGALWCTLREGCLDFVGSVGSLHDLNVRVWAFIDEHYHCAPHAGLMGKSPASVYEDTPRPIDTFDEAMLRKAPTVQLRRRVRRDSTLPMDGTDWQTDLPFWPVASSPCLVVWSTRASRPGSSTRASRIVCIRWTPRPTRTSRAPRPRCRRVPASHSIHRKLCSSSTDQITLGALPRGRRDAHQLGRLLAHQPACAATRGYRHVGTAHWEHANYRSVLLSKRLAQRCQTASLFDVAEH
jgi:hypothetical protein